MDRRSWLWRRKSSEKTPGETESSGSISSPSERFSDEQMNSSYSKQSPEITSKAAPNEESPEKIKSLTEKLSAALLNINAKEELVKQHARVAEEAVTGWEKAEREVAGLKLQLDAALKKNSALEDRVGHLDGALKECVRQLRQARDEQERKLEDLIAQRTHEWESKKSELESKLIELSSQLEAAKSVAAASMDISEKENKSLRLEVAELSKKLDVTTLERDFSTKTAESASKHRLESIKKVAKLEAECRRLRSLTRKASSCFDSFSDSRSDYAGGSLALEPSQSDLRASSSKSIQMDDFLEMERLAALPEMGSGTLSPESRAPSNTDSREENALKVELESMINRNAKLEAEKGELEMALSESTTHLKASEEQLKTTKSELIECQDQLRTTQVKLNAVENELIELQTQLIELEDQFKSSEVKLKDAESNLVELNIQLNERDDQIKASQIELKGTESELVSTRNQLHEMQAQLSECLGKLTASEGQIKDAKKTLEDLQAQLALTSKLKKEVEVELEDSNAKREEAELQVKALEAKINSLVDEADKERALSVEAMSKCRRLEDELSKTDLSVDRHFELPVICKAEKKAEQEKGLAIAADKLADCQKTIASLGKQLKSLATLDDFLLDSDHPLEFSKESPVFFRTSELGKLPCVDCQ